MKVLVRAMSLTVIGLCVCLILMHLLDYNVRLDELNKASHLAMANTQLLCKRILRIFTIILTIQG